MSELNCLRCKAPIESDSDKCSECGETITQFQRTYATKLIDSKYQILDRLGIGGMGEIFKVRHIHLNELRVIKIMRPNIASDEQALQRFLHEAKLSTMVKHRNLAMLYDFSTLDDGSYYMVWEFIDGVNIQKWISQNGPMPARLALEIAIQALMGLEQLHQMGIIHRDISPENIMLSQDHMGKLVSKVIDFGIAKQLDDSQSGGQGLTQTGMFLGKLKYASPEQAGFLKEGDQLDARSDLYTFGVVFYEMLAGRAPFLATNPHSYILKHATEKPPAISALVPDIKVPPLLEAIVMKSLEKDRDQRQQNAAEFIAELEGIRPQIAPDSKFGLGERMITLSAQKTEADAPRPTASGRTTSRPAPTVAGKGQRPAAHPTSSQDATRIERVGGPATLSDSATVIERQGTMGAADEATVMESLGGAAATVLEPKVAQWKGTGEAAATVIERQVGRPSVTPKKKTSLVIGVAAAVAIAIGVGIWAMQRGDTGTTATGTSTGLPTNTATAVTGTAITTTALTPGEGVLLLTALPYGEIDKIIDADTSKPVDLAKLLKNDFSAPRRIMLPAGEYDVYLSSPNAGTSPAKRVRIEPGREAQVLHEFTRIDPNSVVEEILKP